MKNKQMFHVEHFPNNVKQKLELYKDLLLKWQKAINLVSRGTLNDVMVRHIEDSLQLLPFIRGSKILDIGSGGGFPGMVLAMVGQEKDFLKEQYGIEPFDVTCVDSDQRKMTFLSEVARQTSTKVNIITDRIENIQGKYDMVTTRGFANLSTLIELTKKYSDYGVFLKGQKFDQEIGDAQRSFRFDYKVFNSVTDKSGCIIVVCNIKNVDI